MKWSPEGFPRHFRSQDSCPSPPRHCPRAHGHCPRGLGECPGGLGECRRALGHCRRAPGHCLGALGHCPRAPGNCPRALGQFPGALGHCPRALGHCPRAPGHQSCDRKCRGKPSGDHFIKFCLPKQRGHGQVTHQHKIQVGIRIRNIPSRNIHPRSQIS